MAVTLKELWTSRPATVTTRDSTVTRSWIALGSTDENEVYAAVLTTAPLIYDGLVRGSIDLRPLGGPVFEVDVKYGNVDVTGAAGIEPTPVVTPTDATDLGVGFAFDASNVTTHITQSIRTVSVDFLLPGPAPDFKKAIGVTKDKIEGVDVVSGALEISLTVPRANLRLPYMRTLKNMIGKTNDAAWYGFDRGEVLYTGATGQFTGDVGFKRFTVTHKIAVGENQVNIDVGNGITVAAKKAWEYLWVGYDDEDVGGGLVFPVPQAAFVEQVYREGDFHLLEIGG